MKGYGIVFWLMFAVLIASGCQAKQQASTPSTKQSDKHQHTHHSTQKKPLSSKGEGSCTPIEGIVPMHDAFSCIHEAVPPERIIILRSSGDLRRFIARMGRSCSLPKFDFKKHSLVAYKGTASCSVEVKDKFCQGNPWVYNVELIADGFCEKLAQESRFWQVPRLGKDDVISIKRKRSKRTK